MSAPGRWTDRQQAMLREMGLRLWLPPADASAAAASPGLDDQAPTAPPPAASAPGLARRPAEQPQPHAGERLVDRAVEAPADRPTDRPAARPPAPMRPALPRPAGAPGADAIAAMDWPALRQAVADCSACGLCQTRRQTVFGVGHPRAHCMIVGEAPGEQEDAQGEPFVGESGQLLDRMLRALGLSRQDGDPARQVFIANTLKCRPPRNRNPSPEELALCQPFLQRQVALVQPRVILAMGRFAVQSLLGSDAPIGKLRGRVHDWQGVPLVVTYHPAYLLRQPQDKAAAWDDLCRAAQLLDGAPA